jgi:hypothetical protein
MTQKKSPIAIAAQRLTEAVEQETRVARAGVLDDLSMAAAAKKTAFAAFSDLQGNMDVRETLDVEDRKAIHDLLVAANENAVVLTAVKSTLDDAAARLHTLLGAMADPGTYSRLGRPARHVPATRINAKA